MSFNVSPGVYPRELDQSFRAQAVTGNIGGVVIAAARGPLGVTLVTSEREFIRLYGEPTSSYPAMYSALSFVRKVGALNVKRVTVDATSATGEYIPNVDTLLTFTAANPGVWGNDVVITFGDFEDDADLYTMTVSEDGVDSEEFVFSLLETKKDGFGNSQYIEDVINGNSILITVDHDLTTAEQTITPTDTVALATGADDTTPVTDTEVIAGYQAFEPVETVNVAYLINAGWTTSAVQSTIVSVAEARKDCVGILDTPNDTVTADVVDFRKTTSNANSSYAGYYAGWIKQYDVYTSRTVEVPPSGFVAANFALSQQNANPWDAPAGFQRGVISGAGIEGVTKVWSEADRDLLYAAQINPVQDFAGQGIVIWGQKTALTLASHFSRFSTRLLFNYVRNSLKLALRPFVFQGNTAFTRNSVTALVTNFMEDIRVNGGVTDFRVVVEEINTAQVIDANQLLVDVYIKVTATAEFIRLDTIAVPTAQDF